MVYKSVEIKKTAFVVLEDEDIKKLVFIKNNDDTLELDIGGIDGGTKAIAYTTSDQSFSNDVLTNVTELFLPVLANTIYRLAADIHYNALSAANLKLKWTAPVGALFRWDTDDGLTRGLSDAVIVVGDGTDRSVRVSGLLVVAGTAGSLRLQAAQGTTNATPAKVLLHSFVEGWSP